MLYAHVSICIMLVFQVLLAHYGYARFQRPSLEQGYVLQDMGSHMAMQPEFEFPQRKNQRPLLKMTAVVVKWTFCRVQTLSYL